MFNVLLFTRLPITFAVLEMMMIRTKSGGARKPLITAVQNRALTGLIPVKLISIPRKVETAISP
jgi:hypothetical protein